MSGHFEIARWNLLSLQVCTDSDDRAAIEAFASREHPTGLDHGWRIPSYPLPSGDPNPVQCDDHPDRKHWLLTCRP